MEWQKIDDAGRSMESAHTILIVEDDERLAKLISAYLSEQGFEILVEDRGDTGKRAIITHLPALVILDIMLPGMDGFQVCREVRPDYSGPILMLTAREDDMDQVVGLEIGADDYVKKPVEPRVLLARIRALLRRFNTGSQEMAKETGSGDSLQFGTLVIKKTSQTVTLDQRTIDLTTNEFELLWHLAVNSGEILDRDSLFRQTKGISYDGLDRSIDISISRLRKKLGDNSAKPFRIKTIWGKGYLFVDDAWGDVD